MHDNKQGSRAAGKHQRNKKNYTENYILNIIEHINKKWTQKHWGTRTALDFLPNRRTTTTNSFYTISQYYSNQCITFMANNITNLMVTLLKKKPIEAVTESQVKLSFIVILSGTTLQEWARFKDGWYRWFEFRISGIHFGSFRSAACTLSLLRCN